MQYSNHSTESLLTLLERLNSDVPLDLNEEMATSENIARIEYELRCERGINLTNQPK